MAIHSLRQHLTLEKSGPLYESRALLEQRFPFCKTQAETGARTGNASEVTAALRNFQKSRDRRLHLRGRHAAILVGSSRVHSRRAVERECDVLQDDLFCASCIRSSCSSENLRHLPFRGMTLRLMVT
jgi:hypothetical protein